MHRRKGLLFAFTRSFFLETRTPSTTECLLSSECTWIDHWSRHCRDSSSTPWARTKVNIYGINYVGKHFGVDFVLGCHPMEVWLGKTSQLARSFLNLATMEDLYLSLDILQTVPQMRHCYRQMKVNVGGRFRSNKHWKLTTSGKSLIFYLRSFLFIYEGWNLMDNDPDSWSMEMRVWNRILRAVEQRMMHLVNEVWCTL